MSDWETVASSVPQGSVLGSLFFTIFINDLPNKIKKQCQLYADDCKLIGVVNKDEDLEDIQNDIIELKMWAKTWEKTFNYDKCTLVKGIGKKKYTMEMDLGQEQQLIEKTLVEKGLGIIISNDLKWVNEVEKATNSAKSIEAQIRNSFRYFYAELVKLLYVSLVRPHLEFAVSFWNPYHKKTLKNSREFSTS